MEEITLEQLTEQALEWLQAAQKERVVVTKNGKPAALIVGIENKDEEDWNLQLSPEFWRMIEKRRGEPTIPLDAVKAELLAEE